MKIFRKLALPALLACGVFGGNAQGLGQAMVINPYPAKEYQTFLSAVTLTYNFNMVTLTDYNTKVLVEMGGKTYEIYPEVFFDQEIADELGQAAPDNPLWGNELMIDFSEEAYTAGYPVGPYSIKIPAGLVIDEEDETNAYQEINFTKVDPVAPISVTPADGMYEPSDLRKVTITFSEEIRFNPEEVNAYISARKKNDWLNPEEVILDYKISSDNKSLVINLSTLPDGILYTVNVPESFLLVGNYNVNKAVWMEYMPWEGMGAATIISAPEKESSPEPKPFILTWDYQPIKMSINAPETEFVCGFPDYGYQEGWRDYIPASAYKLVSVSTNGGLNENPAPGEANALYLDVTEYLRGFTGYQFEIFFPAGLVTDNEGLENPPFSYVFTVRDRLEYPDIAAEAGVIEMLWPSASWVTYNLGDEEVTMTDESGKTYVLGFTFGHTVPGEVSLINEGGHGLEIDLNGLNLPEGHYVLTVPDSYLVIENAAGENVMNGSITCNFGWKDGNFTDFGNVGIIPVRTKTAVYNLNGLKVKEGNDLRGLPKGIYIVNGKKLVKKD